MQNVSLSCSIDKDKATNMMKNGRIIGVIIVFFEMTPKKEKEENYSEQFAKMVNIETGSLSKNETGRSYPTSYNLAEISKILGSEPFEFFLSENI